MDPTSISLSNCSLEGGGGLLAPPLLPPPPLLPLFTPQPLLPSHLGRYGLLFKESIWERFTILSKIPNPNHLPFRLPLKPPAIDLRTPSPRLRPFLASLLIPPPPQRRLREFGLGRGALVAKRIRSQHNSHIKQFCKILYTRCHFRVKRV